MLLTCRNVIGIACFASVGLLSMRSDLTTANPHSRTATTIPVRNAVPLTIGEATFGAMKDFGGTLCLIGSSTEPVQIVDVVWGATATGMLTPAYFKGADLQGKTIEWDHRDRIPTLFNTLNEMHGFYFPYENGKMEWIDSATFGVSRSGFWTMFAYSGFTEAGVPISVSADPSMFLPDCAWIGVTNCLGACDPSTSTCGGTPPTCTCSAGGTSVSCDPTQVRRCPQNGLCLVTEHCTVSADKCGCYPNNPP